MVVVIKQVVGFVSKIEIEFVFWYYVKEVFNKYELQCFYFLCYIVFDVGWGCVWLCCVFNEYFLECYLYMFLVDCCRFSIFYEDWFFVMDEERFSMFLIMVVGLNFIFFVINIDNKDLNGQSKFVFIVLDFLKELMQNVIFLLKEFM